MGASIESRSIAFQRKPCATCVQPFLGLNNINQQKVYAQPADILIQNFIQNSSFIQADYIKKKLLLLVNILEFLFEF